ncbi:hypothetical protein ISS03_05385 [Patescibacteria group bacterium]|nr:hypothetical protein [Patescibacteria group bacterium]
MTKTITLDRKQAMYLSEEMLKNRNKLRNKKIKSRLKAKEIEKMILSSQILTKINFNSNNFDY